MRIALLVPTMEFGGVERVFANLANGLHQCGAEVDLVIGRAGGDLGATIESGVRVFDLESRHMIEAVPGIAKYLRSREPEAMIAAMTHSSAAAVLARRIARRKTKIVATEHLTMSHVVAHPSGLKYWLMPLWSRWALHSADAIVAVSCGVADDVSARTGVHRNKIRVIYNPVISEGLHIAATDALDHPWFQTQEPPVILAVGRLVTQKDFPMLIRAFRLVRNRRQARLVILGEGPERNQIEQAVHDEDLIKDVALPGFDLNPYRFMRRAAVFALSSQYEGLPTVLVEALALGVPVVSTNCPHGPAEILCDGKFGWLVPVGDHEAMAQGLLTALDSPVRIDDAAHLRQFTAHGVASSYLSLVNNWNNQNMVG